MHLYNVTFFKFFFLTFIYFWDRDRAWTGEGQREGDTESEIGSRLWAFSTEPDTGLELTDWEMMTWAEVGRLTDWATQAPLNVYSGYTLAWGIMAHNGKITPYRQLSGLLARESTLLYYWCNTLIHYCLVEMPDFVLIHANTLILVFLANITNHY